MSEEVTISFDEQNKIRVLESDKFRETDQLKNECMEFVKKVIFLDEIAQTLNETFEDYGKKIENEKLRAIGEVTIIKMREVQKQRNKVEAEQENRKKKLLELSNVLNEKKAELERFQFELESLQKVEQEQRILIEKLSNNEA